MRRLIGAGELGRVWLACDPTEEDWVAIKMIVGSAGRDVAGYAVRTAKVRHDNIVRLLDVGVAGGSVYVMMEVVDGDPLDVWIHRDAPEDAAVIRALVQAAKGIAALHDAGLTHRNIKPSNILRDDEGHVRVSDAQLIIDPNRRSTFADDQDAFCAMARLLFAGRPPASIEPTLRRGMQANPARRFPTMHALADALEGKPIPETTPASTHTSSLAAAVLLWLTSVATWASGF